MEENYHPMNTISFSPFVKKAVDELGYIQWTPIQEKSIPIILEGKDIIGQSHTGSGKTAAFGLPIIERIQPNGRVQVLILVPTRELAEQVMQQMRKFSKYKRVSITSVYGGVGLGAQIQHLRKTDIVVGTPGRILDHLSRGTFNPETVNVLVLDEADRMLDMGFIRDMKKIMSQLPKKRQTMLFSATITTEVQHIAQQFMQHPHIVKAEEFTDKPKLEQTFYDLGRKGDQKFGLLLHILKTEKPAHAIIFAGTRRMVDKVERNLNKQNIHAQAIHGGLSQNQRKRTIDEFHRGTFHVLVASDIAARGLDIQDVSHIIHYNIARTPNEYIHRSGRTGRAGKKGKIISIVTPPDNAFFRAIFRDTTHNLKELPLPEFENIPFGNAKGNRREENYSPHTTYGQQGRGQRFFPRKREIEGKPFWREKQGKKIGNKPNWKGKKTFAKKNYTQREEIKIIKHFGLQHAPKDDR
ncbi:MAG: DEAD/DEAH box helicase [Candidatus Diapherotrites archaeon]